MNNIPITYLRSRRSNLFRSNNQRLLQVQARMRREDEGHRLNSPYTHFDSNPVDVDPVCRTSAVVSRSECSHSTCEGYFHRRVSGKNLTLFVNDGQVFVKVRRRGRHWSNEHNDRACCWIRLMVRLTSFAGRSPKHHRAGEHSFVSFSTVARSISVSVKWSNERNWVTEDSCQRIRSIIDRISFAEVVQLHIRMALSDTKENVDMTIVIELINETLHEEITLHRRSALRRCRRRGTCCDCSDICL